MGSLKLRGATLLWPDGTRVPRRTVTFSRSGVSVWRYLAADWEQVTGLETHAGPGGSAYLVFHRGAAVTRFLIEGLPVAELRDRLLSWVTRTAKDKVVIHLAWDPLADAKTADVHVRKLRSASGRAISAQRAIGLIAQAERDRRNGDIAGAQALLEAVVTLSTEGLGATAAPTIAARNNLAFSLAVSGDRRTAIQMYWALLDDASDGEIAKRRPGSDDFDSLTAARANARRNLAMLHNPRWQP